jgi:hypothetical protein
MGGPQGPLFLLVFIKMGVLVRVKAASQVSLIKSIAMDAFFLLVCH